eukprot:TRINITY_DN104318_c0_g1_i1.p1 TRINITY_DN104318_c0_g1~~TRINITY_DN104318_c0_g1_i1.p1  ORF type:complete len:259 (+),score=66.87 TRINITY_DN104318_c0_g1_i1:55-831(+)
MEAPSGRRPSAGRWLQQVLALLAGLLLAEARAAGVQPVEAPPSRMSLELLQRLAVTHAGEAPQADAAPGDASKLKLAKTSADKSDATSDNSKSAAASSAAPSDSKSKGSSSKSDSKPDSTSGGKSDGKSSGSDSKSSGSDGKSEGKSDAKPAAKSNSTSSSHPQSQISHSGFQVVPHDVHEKIMVEYQPSQAWLDARLGSWGNPLVWAMATVYFGLTVVALAFYCFWSTSFEGMTAMLMRKRPHADMGLPPGYNTYVR